MGTAQEREVCSSQHSQRELEIWSALASDIEMQNLAFALGAFCLALVQDFLITSFSPFRMIGILCHFQLEVCDLLFKYFNNLIILILQGVRVKVVLSFRSN